MEKYANEELSSMTMHVAVQNVKLDFGFCPQQFLSLTGLNWMYFRFHTAKYEVIPKNV
jgi:hypothetical protein